MKLKVIQNFNKYYALKMIINNSFMLIFTSFAVFVWFYYYFGIYGFSKKQYLETYKDLIPSYEVNKKEL